MHFYEGSHYVYMCSRDLKLACKLNAVSAKIDIEGARKEARVTCGANVIIKNVLPFLMLE